MAQISFYNHTRRLFAVEELDLTALKVMLLNGHSFDAAHTNISSIDADEVSGNGWTVGGETIANAAITTTGTNEATLDGDDVVATASGGAIGPADGAVIYHDVIGEEWPLWYIDFEGSEEAGDGTDFRVNWDANGIARWLEPS